MLDKLARGDENYRVRDAAGAYIARKGLDLPEEPEARASYPQPECVLQPIVELDLARAGIGTMPEKALVATRRASWTRRDE